jgi:hypothetical protein
MSTVVANLQPEKYLKVNHLSIDWDETYMLWSVSDLKALLIAYLVCLT